ncbi:hypothetical protein HNQ57_000920 [Zhongshania antarctica]|uniref:Uncharacterized protein n=1 Tax=Zhongshania antarctica TaxID=641702 RepID=A0A840R0N7_9GAMM|nr:hypothetical protein [Zhongshania antarctica]MBB5186659.1 hypothetical protein [Zhongshania antarctica]
MGAERRLAQAIGRERARQALYRQELRGQYHGYRRHLSAQLAKPESLGFAFGVGLGVGLYTDLSCGGRCRHLLTALLGRQLHRALWAVIR